MKHYLFLFLGICIGILGTFGYNHYTPLSRKSALDVALGEVFYEQLQYYASDWDIRHVAKVIEELKSNKRKPQEEEKRDRALIDSAAKKSEKLAEENLEKAESYLSTLIQKEGVFEIVRGKVYAEILQEGVGATIANDDVLSVHFKEYDMDGKILKDTTMEKAYSIPLSQMIKGFQLGMTGARVGERRKLYIHPDHGFAKIGRGRRPNQLLIYEVVVKEKILKNPGD